MSQSSASTRGLLLRLQAEPGRGEGRLDPPLRCTAIFNRTALVGLWTVGVTRSDAGHAGQMRGAQSAEVTNRWRNERVRKDGVEIVQGETHFMHIFTVLY